MNGPYFIGNVAMYRCSLSEQILQTPVADLLVLSDMTPVEVATVYQLLPVLKESGLRAFIVDYNARGAYTLIDEELLATRYGCFGVE
jgi:ABC-type lipopolysaccharide export system ATPase subunit